MKYVISSSLSIKKIADEIFILNRADSQLHSFNKTGAFLWNLLSEGVAVADLAVRLTEAYDVDAETASRDVEEFLHLCESRNLIRIEP